MLGPIVGALPSGDATKLPAWKLESKRSSAVTDWDRGRRGQFKSREPVRDLAEVYTHEREVKRDARLLAILDEHQAASL